MSDYLLWFLGTGLLLFVAACAVAYVVVRFLFVRIAERISAQMALHIETAATAAATGISRSVASRPRVVQAGKASAAATALLLKRLDRMERLMDRVIPLPLVGGIGLDALLGLIPYVGDAVSALVSGSIILKSLQFGVPKDLVAKMVANMFVDLLFGSIPVIGDVFDVAFKANTRNVALLRAHLARVQAETRYKRAPQRLQ